MSFRWCLPTPFSVNQAAATEAAAAEATSLSPLLNCCLKYSIAKIHWTSHALGKAKCLNWLWLSTSCCLKYKLDERWLKLLDEFVSFFFLSLISIVNWQFSYLYDHSWIHWNYMIPAENGFLWLRIYISFFFFLYCANKFSCTFYLLAIHFRKKIWFNVRLCAFFKNVTMLQKW